MPRPAQQAQQARIPALLVQLIDIPFSRIASRSSIRAVSMLRCSLHAAAFSAAASRPRQRGLQPHSSKRELRCSAGADGGAPAARPPPADRPLDHKVALITGANTGIGYQTAKALLQRDYQVVLACRDRTKAEAARAKLRHAAAEPDTSRGPAPRRLLPSSLSSPQPLTL